ncbi:MAG: hypothetical protein AB7P17_06235 [Nitrospirales bacterium]|nr:hypothetical protein [Nitrospirales bacterium]
MRAVDAVDMLKSERPILGERKGLDYAPAQTSHLPEQGSMLEAVTQELVEYCSGQTLSGTPAPNKM